MAKRLSFQSTLPAGEATWMVLSIFLGDRLFQSTLPAGEATQLQNRCEYSLCISIHASRGGSDPGDHVMHKHGFLISIHASRGGSDCHAICKKVAFENFNPRFPRGKRPCFFGGVPSFHRDFNPRFPRGKRQWFNDSITSFSGFQSTLPAREATENK